jgi:transposase
VAKPFGSVNFSSAELEQLQLFAGAGISRVEAARRLGRSPSTVIRRVSQMGLEWTPPPRHQGAEKLPWVNPNAWTEADDRWLIALAEAGWTQGMAANEMDRPHRTIWRHSKMLGIRWPKGSKSRKGDPIKRPD